MNKNFSIVALAFTALLLVGCGYSLPEATKKNCLDSSVAMEVDEKASLEQKQEYSTACQKVIMEDISP